MSPTFDLPRIQADTTDQDELDAARERHWLASSDRGLEILRYEEGRSALGNPVLKKGVSFLKRLDQLEIFEGTELRDRWNLIVTTTEGVPRRRLRAPLTETLKPRATMQMQPMVAQVVNDALDEIESDADLGDIDLMREFAWKVPSRVYCHMIAAPLDFAPVAARLSDSTLAPLLTQDLARRQESIDAFDESWAAIAAHMEHRRRDRGDDFASYLIGCEERGELSHDEMIASGVSILQASVDNTVHQLGMIFGTLLEEPEPRWGRVVENPELIDSAIEEVIRLRPRFGTIFRQAPETFEFYDVEIEAGTWVYVSVRAAQRDPRAFEDAATFKVDRRAQRQLMFGSGQYNCLGQHLARLEFREAVKAVVERFPRIRLAEDWAMRHSSAVSEVEKLRVALD